MSKKKIVILIIILMILAGLAWFFWPKITSYSYYKGKQCDCFGFEQEFSQEKFDKSYLCYGLLYHCREEVFIPATVLEVYRVNTEGVKWSDKSKHTLLKSFSRQTEKGIDIISKLTALLNHPYSYEEFNIDWEGFPTYRFSVLITEGEITKDITDVYITPSVNYIIVHRYDGILNRDGYRIVNSGSYKALKEEYDQLLLLMGIRELSSLQNIINCEKLEEQIHNLIEQANYCNVDTDCVISTEFWCPFNVYNLFNKNADLTNLGGEIEKYNQDCLNSTIENNCLLSGKYDRLVTPKANDIKCVDNKCVDVRFTK